MPKELYPQVQYGGSQSRKLHLRRVKNGHYGWNAPGSKLWDNMLKREVTNLYDFYERAQKYIRVEDGHENLKAGKNESHVKPSAHGGSNGAKKKRAYEESRDDHQRRPKSGSDPR